MTLLAILSCTEPVPPSKLLEPIEDTSSPESRTGDSPTLVEEVCDGVDNDGDGLVDEEMPDRDLDGVADCVDPSCETESTQATSTAEEAQCLFDRTPADDPYDIEILWERDLSYNTMQRMSSVGDVSGDGYADIILTSYLPHKITILSGNTGDTLIEMYDVFTHLSPTALVDINGDQVFEIIGIDPDYHVKAIDGQGNTIWISQESSMHYMMTSFTYIAIIEIFKNNSHIQVSTSDLQINALTGEFLDDFIDQNIFQQRTNIVSIFDANLDNNTEIYTCNNVFNENGDLLFEFPSNICMTFFALPIQADNDDEAEIFSLLANEQAFIYDHNYNQLTTFPMDTFSGAVQPCAGDLDGDHLTEIIVSQPITINGAVGYRLASYNSDGSLDWAHILPVGSITGCTTFDFDLDNAKEVLIRDTEGFRILDGRTGIPLFEDASACVDPMNTAPMVVDLDNDGSVELIDFIPQFAPCDTESNYTIRVYRHRQRQWPPGSTFWPWIGWSGVGMFPDGTIPDRRQPSWLTTNVWNGQPEFLPTGRDLRPVLTDSCAAGCEDTGELRLQVAIQNLGPQDGAAPHAVSLYALDGGGAPAALLRTLHFDPLPVGTQSSSVEVVLSRAEAAYGVQLVAGDDGQRQAEDDCDPSNNALTFYPDCL